MTVPSRPLKELFLSALEVSPNDRAEWLDRECASDAGLREQLNLMLAAHDTPHSLLDQPAVVEPGAGIDPPVAEKLGTQIGPYKLREQIGEGGMGVVYVAEQSKPVKRKVALKLIKLGMASRDVVARFEGERQALAIMDHSNIAKVHDAGATDSGQPFFVMELVQGPPITEYCDQHRLSVRARLELFLSVCRAVNHAHQKGVIHRDLKPSNILVPEIDGAPVPKVIDFGVAKAIDQKLTEQTVYTQFSQLVGTPLYMSPEQAGLGVVDVDTRSDVYSLGVLLYELLTGSTPFDSDTLKQASFDEMRRIIREDEPQRPSARMSTLAANAQSTVGKRRGSDARQIGESLKGELDWIVMTALEKDRGRRYESVSALADDIERHLRDEPIVARPASRWYRTQKFVRRHRALVVSSSVVVVALVAGLALATAGLLHAIQQRDVAKRAEEDARIAKGLAEERAGELAIALEDQRAMTSVFLDMHPTDFLRSTSGRTRTVLESIDAIARQIDEEGRLSDHPRVEIDVRSRFAQSYFDVGEYDKFRHHLEKALVLAKKEYGDSLTVARMHMRFAYSAGAGADRIHDRKSTLEHANEAIRIYKLQGAVPDDRVYVGKAYSLQVWPERHAEAIAAAQKAKELDAENPIYTLSDLGNIYGLMGDNDSLNQAIECHDAALVNYRKSDNPHNHLEANLLSKRAHCHRRRAELDAAREDYQAAYKLYLRSEPSGQMTGVELADHYFAMGHVNEAFDILDEVKENAGEFNVASSRILSLDLKGWLHFQLGDFETAEPLLEEAKQLAVDEYGVMDGHFALPCSQLALIYEAMKDQEQAKEQYRKLLPWTQHFVDAPWVDSFAYWLHARGILATHDDVALRADDGALLDEAEKIANDGLENTRAWRQPNQEAAFYLVKAMIQQVRNPEKLQDAIDLLNEGLKKVPEPTATIRNARVYQTPTDRWQLESKLVEFLVDADRVAEAHDLMIKAVAHRRLNLDKLRPDHIQTILAEIRLGEFRIQHNLHDGDTLDELADAVEKLRQFSPVVDDVCRKWAQQLIETYEDFGDADKAVKWRSKLDGLQKTDDDFKQARAEGLHLIGGFVHIN